MVERVRASILRLINVERYGGRVRVEDPQTLVLYDCGSWGAECTEAVASVYPDVRISVRACRQSLTGFVIVFQLNRCLRAEVGWYFVIGGLISCCGFILFRSSWWPSAAVNI